MIRLSGSEIREAFLRFFEEKGHQRVHSSSLVPANDPTLLFTNAGMNQFKDVFLGLEKRSYTRAASSQKCVRAGGKHNDLENVGFTNRHHTFFEMLGNFSFGDYFKKEAIANAWELITERLAIPRDKLYVTIFKGEAGVPRDDEAHGYWVSAGIAPDRIYELGAKDNFWAMGDTGPCGPCSEIHYDMGQAASDAGHTDCKFGCECGRYVEIWNLVFMQFERNLEGELVPLPKPSIDTGMGLERLAAVLQGVISNYETDLFTPLIRRAAELTSVSLPRETARESHGNSAASLRVVADHSRCATFLIADGVLPANEGRGYVLRKILRRGIRHGRLLGQSRPFMHEMVYAVRDEVKDAYPELVESADKVAKIILAEERRFAHTLDLGLKRLEQDFAPLLAQRSSAEAPESVPEVSGKQLAPLSDRDNRPPGVKPVYGGEKAFKLYDTFGLPLDFIADAARDQGLEFDEAGFQAAMDQQRSQARASWKGGSKQSASPVYRELEKTRFLGYTQTTADDCEVLAILREGAGVQQLGLGEHGEIVLNRTPFYADSGGQVGDQGWFYSEGRSVVVANVHGCVLPVQGVRAHKVTARQSIHLGDKIVAVVDAGFRESTVRNHTGTHLLHAALREVLGKHVKQAGSLVDPQHLRFDFSHFTGVPDEELQDIEDLANQEVLKNTRVDIIEDVPIDVAINEYKAMALFGEKYGEKVRVVKIGDFSTELCGGIHNRATGEIGLLKILNEGSVSSGVRRVEAITGTGSLAHFRRDHELEHMVTGLVGRAEGSASPAQALRLEMEKKDDEIRKLRKELDQLRMKSAATSVASAEEKIKEVNGIKVLAQRVDNLDRGQMRTLVDNLRNKLGSGVVVLGSAGDGKVSLIVGVTKDLTARVHAGKIVGAVAQKVGGSGGGRPDMAEAGGKNPEELDQALAEVLSIVGSLSQ